MQMYTKNKTLLDIYVKRKIVYVIAIHNSFFFVSYVQFKLDFFHVSLSLHRKLLSTQAFHAGKKSIHVILIKNIKSKNPE